VAAAENTGLPFEPSVQGAQNYWQGLSRPLQVGVIAAAGAFIVFTIMMVSYLGSPGMEVLFQDIQPEQAREVVQRLEDEGISYELARGGTEIRVPDEERDRLRLELAPDMHAQGVGFEIYEDTGLLTSEYERRKQHQAALQEELRRTIAGMDGVSNARVHLALPDPRELAWDAAEPRASVKVDAAPAASLQESQFQGIVYLVAGSVENLEPENIHVTDSSGQVLYNHLQHAGNNAAGATQVERQMQLERQFELNLESRLQSVLERLYGEGGAEVMISARLNFDERDVHSIEYDDEGTPRSEQRIEERHETEGGELEEEVGDANIPGYQTPYMQGDSEYEYDEEIVNYEISTVEEMVSEAPGDVEELSAMVTVNEDGPARDVPEAHLNQLISSALGHSPELGEITFSYMPFEEIPEEPDWYEADHFVENVVEYVVYAIVALLAFILLLVLILRKTAASGEPQLAAEGMPQGFALEDVMQQSGEEQKEEEERREKVKELAEENPEQVAMLLRTWMTEE